LRVYQKETHNHLQIAMVMLIPGAMERNLVGLGDILFTPSTSTQPQRAL
jgi:hypothetical protein